MAIDASTIVPASVQRNLADKLYEKRKNAALEVLVLYFCNIFVNTVLCIVYQTIAKMRSGRQMRKEKNKFSTSVGREISYI